MSTPDRARALCLAGLLAAAPAMLAATSSHTPPAVDTGEQPFSAAHTIAQAGNVPLIDAPAPVPPIDAQAPPDTATTGSTLKVFLMTVGQGTFIWEKFGHNAIWLYDEATGVDAAYNYGVFDFDSPGYYGRLVRGEMLYSLVAYRGTSLANAYRSDNRSIWIQELNLTEAQTAELRTFLETNALPENRDYLYDYFRDNCSTRVRDAIDRATGGAVRAALERVATETTYRWHSSRLTADEELPWTGLLLAMGGSVDRRIDAWRESFLPVQLMKHMNTVTVTGEDGVARPLVAFTRQLFEATRPPERGLPPDRTVLYGMIGLLAAGTLILLARSWQRRAARMVFFTLAIVWAAATGVTGALINWLWAFSQHVDTYNNENVLQANVLSLGLLVLLVLAATGRAMNATWKVALAVAALSLAGLLVALFFPAHQANGPIVLLAVPVHAALAWSLWRCAKVPVRQPRPAAVRARPQRV